MLLCNVSQCLHKFKLSTTAPEQSQRHNSRRLAPLMQRLQPMQHTCSVCTSTLFGLIAMLFFAQVVACRLLHGRPIRTHTAKVGPKNGHMHALLYVTEGCSTNSRAFAVKAPAASLQQLLPGHAAARGRTIGRQRTDRQSWAGEEGWTFK